VWRSTTLAGGWTATHVGTAPCSGGGSGLDFCRAHIGHPELSTTSNLLMSYYNPADAHVKVMAVPLVRGTSGVTGLRPAPPRGAA
jgi:hypothetical protein